MIYLDNSATSLVKPQAVVDAFNEALAFSANAGRSSHALALKAALAVYDTRMRVAAEFDCKAENVIFGFNCSDALNLAILGSTRGRVVTSAFEHNSVIRPLVHASRVGALFDVVVPRNGLLYAEDFERLITRDTVAIVVNHVSNVTGAIAPIRELGEIARRYNLNFIVDGAQSCGYIPVSMRENNIDAYCFSPHKGLHGMQGLGVLCKSERFKLAPIRFGGTGTDSALLTQPSDSPEGFESGTLPVANIYSLKSALDCVDYSDFARVRELGEEVRRKLSENRNAIVYTRAASLGNIVSFNLRGISATELGTRLDREYGIAVRSGLHCAPLCHRYLGTLDTGAVRVSLGYDNTEDDVKELIRAVNSIQN